MKGTGGGLIVLPRKFRNILPLSILALAAVGFEPSALAQCDQPDAPDCACFNGARPWDAGGPSYPGTIFIQDVALDTVGVEESCNCNAADLTGCTWDPDPGDPDVNFSHAGKPYYQFTLGYNTVGGALFAAELMAYNPAVSFHSRQNWCSEVVSYWHRETALPYLYGYRNDWHPQWLIDNVADLRAWYMTEERLLESHSGGRGIWISARALDYSDFEPGVNAPVPGAYIAFADFDDDAPAKFVGLKHSHSAIIDEMWIHRNSLGHVFQVEISLLEGNVGRAVLATPGFPIPDLLTYTPQGSQSLRHYSGPDELWNTPDDVFRRIWGFGVDLDTLGRPVYDPSRLHEVEHNEILYEAATVTVPQEEDDAWLSYAVFLDDLADYADSLEQEGGPVVRWSYGVSDPLPDGQAQNAMHFPENFVGEVLVDLKGPHPLPIRGLDLTWGPGSLPRGYSVEFFEQGQQSNQAEVPGYGQLVPPADMPVPVPILLDAPAAGVRYIRLFFPEGSVPAPAQLVDLSLRFEGSPWEDAPSESLTPEIPVFVDVKPGSCPNPLGTRERGVVSVAILGSWHFDVTAIDPASITPIGSRIFPLRWAYEDVSTPFIGSSGECHTLGEDGLLDLRLEFNGADLADYLGAGAHWGETIPLLLEGSLEEEQGGTTIRGRDWIRVSPPCDLDNDGNCDLDDRAVLWEALRTCEADPAYIAAADYDGDQCITFNDYRLWYAYFRLVF